MIRTILAICLWFPVAAFAADQEQLDALHDALKTDELMLILSEEGITQSDELRDEMFPNRGQAGWRIVVQEIYAPSRMKQVFRTAFDTALADTDLEEILTFYSDGPGAEIAALEVEARRAISSDEVEDAARQAFADLEADSTRLNLLQQFADNNNLVDRNVAGALNANLAFFRGLGSADGFDMPEDQILSDVWAREPEIRTDTTDWVFGYMTFAFEPLSDATLKTYIDVSATDAGRSMNRALFAAFDALFQDVSFKIGAAAGRLSVGDEL